MCFPKDWWLSSTRRVGLFKDAWGDEAKFSPPSILLPLYSSSQPLLLIAAATSARGFPRFPSGQGLPPNQTAPSFSQLLSGWLSVTYDKHRAVRVTNDAAEDPRHMNGQKKLAAIDMTMQWIDRRRRESHWCSVVKMKVVWRTKCWF